MAPDYSIIKATFVYQSLSNQSNSRKKDNWNSFELPCLVVANTRMWISFRGDDSFFKDVDRLRINQITDFMRLNIILCAVSEKFRWSRLRWTHIHEMKMKFTLTAPRVELFWVNAAIFPDTNLLTEKMFNFFSDKPALKLGQQFTGTSAETPLTLLFSRLNAVNAAIFPVKRR